ncbi:MAG: helix-turn-helix domain-containing protein [Treponema sp.]|nr:helix-turn-helix domain-containing protein [Treponema sp.]
MDKYQKDFINNMKYLRSIKGLSQAQLAESCKVATGTIGNIECGLAKPSFDLIIAIASVLNVEPSELFQTTETEVNVKHNLLDEHKILKDVYSQLKNFFE